MGLVFLSNHTADDINKILSPTYKDTFVVTLKKNKVSIQLSQEEKGALLGGLWTNLLRLSVGGWMKLVP